LRTALAISAPSPRPAPVMNQVFAIFASQIPRVIKRLPTRGEWMAVQPSLSVAVMPDLTNRRSGM
jgi:hypothetical protein